MKNKTKIIATVGPSSSSKETLKAMINAGVNVFRINFSHGTHETHQQSIDRIHELNNELETHVAILADLGGPKLRVGMMKNGGVDIETGQEIIFTNEECEGTSEKVFMAYTRFSSDVKENDRILIDDGKLLLHVIETDGKSEVKAKVTHGGRLSSRKGVNLPNTKVSLPSLTDNDKNDLEFALNNNVSWVALSFVRSPLDIIELKHIIANMNGSAKVIAKIEKPEAIEELNDIIKEADAIMVARGDLGVEIPLQDVPIIQKNIIDTCLEYAKPVIIATQMMESMIDSVTPSRAEVNDVANAVIDGADAVMLSGETSVGQYPVQVIETMYKIVLKSETRKSIYHKQHELNFDTDRFLTNSICDNAVKLGERVDAKAIVTMTFSGYTAFKISSYRPSAGVFVFTGNRKILNMLSLVWGVRSFYYDKFVSTDHTIADIKFLLRKGGYLKDGDLVINIASIPITEKGMTNMLKLSYVK